MSAENATEFRKMVRLEECRGVIEEDYVNTDEWGGFC